MASDRSSNRHPTGFWFIFWGELAERASYYGMRAILALFITDELGYSEADAASVMQLFIALAYLLPLLGGWVADRFLGKFNTIVLFSLPYILGHIVLGFTDSPALLYVSLVLLSVGAGAIKPNTSPLLGMMYEQAGKQHLMGAAFSYFYMSVNVGAAASQLSLPRLRDAYGYGPAFIAPAVLMALSLLAFAAGKRFYPVEAPGRHGDAPALTRADWRQLWRLLVLFPLISVFYLVYDQQASTWIYFARKYCDLTLWPFGITLTPDQIQGFNPVLIVVLTPVMTGLWYWLDRRTGRITPPRTKVFIGFCITVAAIALMAVAGALAGPEAKISIWWLVLATLVITVAELSVVVVGLQMAYTDAPAHAKSTVTALFWATVFVGNLIAAAINQLYDLWSPGQYFAFQTLLIALAGALFYLIAFRLAPVTPPAAEVKQAFPD